LTLPIIAIRPEPGCAATVAAGEEAGMAIEGWPIFAVRPLAWDAPPADSFDALLLGSANALRDGGAALAAYRGKPAYAVGEATADAARAAGFDVAAIASGGLQGLLDTEANLPPRLLRIAGAEHVPLTAPQGAAIVTRIAYESVALPMPAPLAERLRTGALVLLHSAVAARHFADECGRLGVPRVGVSLAALGSRIAAAAGPGWRSVRFAEVPREPALLALAADMCHEPPRAMD
jgi:uroporphyrinogen-III synthase